MYKTVILLINCVIHNLRCLGAVLAHCVKFQVVELGIAVCLPPGALFPVSFLKIGSGTFRLQCVIRTFASFLTGTFPRSQFS